MAEHGMHLKTVSSPSCLSSSVSLEVPFLLALCSTFGRLSPRLESRFWMLALRGGVLTMDNLRPYKRTIVNIK